MLSNFQKNLNHDINAKHLIRQLIMARNAYLKKDERRCACVLTTAFVDIDDVKNKLYKIYYY